jgi:peptidoglycan hydrolase-like protein with peptidoglycan-binding domain
MRRIRPLMAAAAALALTSGIAVLPALMSAAPASAQASCAGTSLKSAGLGFQVRVPTTGNGTGNTNCDLGVGNQGAAVKTLQTALDKCNLFDNLTVDGMYGPLTQEAVEDVQQADGIHVDGIFGPQTSSHMDWPLVGVSGVCGAWS